MGQQVSKTGRRIAQRWNAENRVSRFMDKEVSSKPAVAPKHESTKQIIQDFQKAHPEYLEAQQKKNDLLHARLQGANVNPDKLGEVISKKRPLPQNRAKEKYPEFGYLEPDVVIKGTCSIREIMELVNKHKAQAHVYTVKKLALDYGMETKVIQNIVDNFHVLKVVQFKQGLEVTKDEKKEPEKVTVPDYGRLKPGGVGVTPAIGSTAEPSVESLESVNVDKRETEQVNR